MTSAELAALIPALVGFLVAVTAVIRAELAARLSRQAHSNSVTATQNAALAIARTARLVPPSFPQGGVPIRPDLPVDNPDKNN